MTTPCRLFDTGPETGASNMDNDERLLSWVEANPGACALRFFGWAEPTLTIGRTQYPYISDVKGVVRRPTGGGLVLHKPGEMSFSFSWGAEQHRPHLLKNAGGIQGLYRNLHEIFKEALGKLGYECDLYRPSKRDLQPSLGEPAASECFRDYTESDILLNGRKILGGALWRTKKAFLYQGTFKINDIQPAVSWDQAKAAISSALQARLHLKFSAKNPLKSRGVTA